MSARRHVLIGGSGFIGTRLAARLEHRGTEFAIGDIAPSKLFPKQHVTVDVRDRSALVGFLRADDVIVNLAAAHRDDVRPLSVYHDVNVNGMETLLAAAAQVGATRVVFTSSASVYGNATPASDETAETRPINEYGRTKLLAEGVLVAWQAAKPERRVTIIRPTVVFGEGNRGNVYNLLRAISGPRYVMVGAGTVKKSTAYVENVAAAIEWSAARTEPLSIFNYADGPDFSMTQLVELVRSALGRTVAPTVRLPRGVALAMGQMADVVARVTRTQLPLSRVRVEKFTQHTTFSAARIRAAGFQPEVSLADGLRRFIDSDFR